MKNYKLLFQNNNNEKNGDIGASSYDYLEKIFQIPIKLQQISCENSKQYINSLLEESLAIHIDENSTIMDNTASESLQLEIDNLDQDTGQVDQDIFDKFETMIITKDDIKDIDEFTSILGNTPRTIKRFVNIYKLIKARYPNLENNSNILFMISIITGLPYISMDIFSNIQEKSNTEYSIKEIINYIGDDLKTYEGKFDKLKKVELDKMKVFLSNSNFNNITVAELKPLVPIIGRYSFHLDDLA